MKIAIVTIYDFYNHGNRLQNYALEKALLSLDKDNKVETLAITPKKVYSFFLKMAKCFPFLKRTKRLNKSIKFSKQDLNNIIIDSYSIEKLKKIGNEFDCVVVGSDQVWNPSYMANSDISFLRFANGDKCVSFAPSFGVSQIDDKYKMDYIDGLGHIKYLSVRENEGAKIIKEFIEKDVPVVVDPTMLLTKKDWEEFASPVSDVPEKYILTYFLGEPKEYKDKVNKIAKENNLKVININKESDKFYKVNPKEFIYLMKNAELICTNSFHGHALSIMLEKPFISFSSLKNTKSRINTLLNLVNIKDRNYTTISDDKYFEIDYSEARERISEQRKQSIAFLKNSLKDIEKSKVEKDD